MIKQLESLGKITLNKSFKELTTIKVGGNAFMLFEPNSIDALKKAVKIINDNNFKYKVLGNGSNVLSSDKDYDGVVIKLTNLKHFEVEDEVLYTEAGVSLPFLANYTNNNGLSGLQFATGIPAMLGGAIFMNAGAYKESMSDIVMSVQILKDNELLWLSADKLEYAYRTSVFQKEANWIIVAAKLKLKKFDSKKLKAISLDRNTRRKDTQPLLYPNCGSIFRNLDNVPAWRIIDELNLRGKQLGGAQISEKHSNFIVNNNNSLATDVNELINLILSRVKAEKNIDLILEVERFNW